jgi:uncharacterized protein involved in exopolysaccharide biosynthesis/Mrp family chromosome partitioning ATPase
VGGQRGGRRATDSRQAPNPPLSMLTSTLRRRGLGIAAWVLGSVVVGVLGTRFIPERFEANAAILVETEDGVADSGLPALGWFGRAGQIATETEMLKSRRVLGAAVGSLALHATLTEGGRAVARSDFLPTLRVAETAVPAELRLMRDGPSWILSDASGTTLGSAEPGDAIRHGGLELIAPEVPKEADFRLVVTPFQEALKSVQERVRVSLPSRDGRVIAVHCDGPTAWQAHVLCQEVSEGYIRLKTELHRSEAATAADFLLDQSEVLHQRLRAAEDSLEAYTRVNQAVALEDRATEEVRRLADVVSRRAELDAERFALQQIIQRLETSPNRGSYRDLASFPNLIGNPAVNDLIATLVVLDNRRSELAVLRSPENAELAALDERLSNVHGQLRQLADAYLAGLAAQAASYARVESESSARLSLIPTQQVEVTRLEREATLLGDLYSLIETRRREAELARAIEMPRVRILDLASMPVEPAAPKPLLNALLSLVAGLALGLAWALMRELRDHSVRDQHRLEVETGLPVLTAIPTARDELLFDAPMSPARVSESRGRTLSAASARARASFRALATDLTHVIQRADGEGLKSIAVVSLGPDDGRTFVATNLALARCSLGLETALVDADPYDARASHQMGLGNVTGLSDVLGNGLRLAEVVRFHTSWEPGDGGEPSGDSNETSRTALALVPWGRSTDRAASLLRAPLFSKVIDAMADRFGCVVLDTPPLLSSSEAIEISNWVGGVVLVVREGATDRYTVQAALERLRRVGANLIGVVLTGADGHDLTPQRTMSLGSAR